MGLYFRDVRGVNEWTLPTGLRNTPMARVPGDAVAPAGPIPSAHSLRIRLLTSACGRYAARIIRQYSIFIVTAAPAMIAAKVMIEPSARVENPVMP